MADIRYEKILQRQGLRSELPTLDSGEFGFTTDTAQLFIGTDPSDSEYVKASTISIDPFPNARQVIQSHLNNYNSINNTTHEISETLQIVFDVPDDYGTEDEAVEEAISVMNYINDSHDHNIARLERNIEIITSDNINEYSLPWDFNASYTPSTGSQRPSRNIMTKVLDSEDAGVFLEYDIKQVFHLRVNYTLVQNGGWHRRSGTITLVGDNGDNPNGYIGFDDDQLLYNAALSSDFIQFDASVDSANSKIKVLFNQPSDHETKIYYRIERWNIAGVVDGGFTSLPLPPPNQVLGIDDEVMGLNSGSVLGVDNNDDNLDYPDNPPPE